MSVYLYWLWTDHLAGASRSETQWAFLGSGLQGKSLVMAQVLCTVQQSPGIWFGEVQPEPNAVDIKDTGFSLLALSLSNRLRLKGNAAYIQSIGGHNIHWCGLYGRNEADQSLTKQR